MLTRRASVPSLIVVGDAFHAVQGQDGHNGATSRQRAGRSVAWRSAARRSTAWRSTAWRGRPKGRSVLAAGVASLLLFGASAPLASAGGEGPTTSVIVTSLKDKGKDEASKTVKRHHGKVTDDL